MNKEQREELKRLAAEATPGPWVTGNTDQLLFGAQRGHGTEPIGFVYGPSFAEKSELGRKALSTSGFIAAANPQAITALLSALEAAEAENDRLRMALGFYANPSDYKAPFTGGLGKLWADCGITAKEAMEAK